MKLQEAVEKVWHEGCLKREHHVFWRKIKEYCVLGEEFLSFSYAGEDVPTPNEALANHFSPDDILADDWIVCGVDENV